MAPAESIRVPRALALVENKFELVDSQIVKFVKRQISWTWYNLQDIVIWQICQFVKQQRICVCRKNNFTKNCL